MVSKRTSQKNNSNLFKGKLKIIPSRKNAKFLHLCVLFGLVVNGV